VNGVRIVHISNSDSRAAYAFITAVASSQGHEQSWET